MSRAALVLIVLAFTVGHNAALFCRAWCDPSDATRPACHHAATTTSMSVIDPDDCSNVMLTNAAFLPEEVQRGASAPTTTHVAAVALVCVAPRPSFALDRFEPGQPLPFASPHQLLTLRL